MAYRFAGRTTCSVVVVRMPVWSAVRSQVSAAVDRVRGVR